MSVRAFLPRASAVLPALAAASGVFGLAACGSSVGSGVPTAWVATNTGLRFTQCMRGHGVPSFPDPLPGGGFPRGSGIGQSSSAFQTAQKACRRILGPSEPGRAPTAAERAAALKYSTCMRDRGVPSFPDPVAAARAGGNALVEGGIVFPIGSSIDPASPSFQQAASACGPRGAGGGPKGG